VDKREVHAYLEQLTAEHLEARRRLEQLMVEASANQAACLAARERWRQLRRQQRLDAGAGGERPRAPDPFRARPDARDPSREWPRKPDPLDSPELDW
jgi:hypothetical protein